MNALPVVKADERVKLIKEIAENFILLCSKYCVVDCFEVGVEKDNCCTNYDTLSVKSTWNKRMLKVRIGQDETLTENSSQKAFEIICFSNTTNLYCTTLRRNRIDSISCQN